MWLLGILNHICGQHLLTSILLLFGSAVPFVAKLESGNKWHLQGCYLPFTYFFWSLLFLWIICPIFDTMWGLFFVTVFQNCICAELLMGPTTEWAPRHGGSCRTATAGLLPRPLLLALPAFLVVFSIISPRG